MKLLAIMIALIVSGCGATLDANKIKPVKPWAAETIDQSQMRGTHG